MEEIATAAPTAATGPADSETSTPAAVDAFELGGTSWNVTNYGATAGVITNLWPGTQITLTFDDETVTGFSGCNEYGGSYQVEGSYDEFEEGIRDENDGQAIGLGTFTVTEKSCTPDHVMEQEMEYLSALVRAERWFIARGNLILRSPDSLIEAEPVE